jgi:hypothetical protein
MSRLPEQYPDGPGFKTFGPSEEAATRITPTAAAMRATVLQVYANTYPQGLTADEVASALNLSVLSVRPRVSELHRSGSLSDTGSRRQNSSGMTATVWRFVPLPPGQTQGPDR